MKNDEKTQEGKKKRKQKMKTNCRIVELIGQFLIHTFDCRTNEIDRNKKKKETDFCARDAKIINISVRVYTYCLCMYQRKSILLTDLSVLSNFPDFFFLGGEKKEKRILRTTSISQK